MTTILIIGSSELLGIRLTARLLVASSEHRVLWIVEDINSSFESELISLVCETVRHSDVGPGLDTSPEAIRKRLSLIMRGPDLAFAPLGLTGSIQAREVWFLAGTLAPGPCGALQSSYHESLERVLSLLSLSRTTVFNYVGSLYGRGRESLQEAVEHYCDTHGMAYRTFLTSLIVGQYHLLANWGGGGDILQLLWPLHDVIAEVNERFPGYFDFQPLRWLVPPGADVNLVCVDDVVDFMSRSSSQPDTPASRYRV